MADNLLEALKILVSSYAREQDIKKRIERRDEKVRKILEIAAEKPQDFMEIGYVLFSLGSAHIQLEEVKKMLQRRPPRL